MERRGGCCIAMYGGAGDADVAWKVGRIMLRFRPIAPRPVSVAAATGSPAIAPAEASAASRRPKRKGSANPGGSGGRGRKAKKPEPTAVLSSSSKDDEKASSSSSTTSSSTIVTLPLMPETPLRKDQEPEESPKQPPPTSAAAVMPAWMRLGEGGAPVVAPQPARAARSWVTAECVTETWREGQVTWRSDEAVRAALAADECPGFVSDVWDRVTWTNEAYRRMVVGSSCKGAGEGEEEEEEVVTTGLVTRGLVTAAGACRAFTCMVRVRYARRPGSGKRWSSSSSLAAPCDVWRLDSGGCAWRLDVKAALSLSL